MGQRLPPSSHLRLSAESRGSLGCLSFSPGSQAFPGLRRFLACVPTERQNCRGPPYPASLMSHHLQQKKATRISTAGPLSGEALSYLSSPGATHCTHNKWPRSQLVTRPPSFPTGQLLEECAARLPCQGRSQGPLSTWQHS